MKVDVQSQTGQISLWKIYIESKLSKAYLLFDDCIRFAQLIMSYVGQTPGESKQHGVNEKLVRFPTDFLGRRS